MRKSWFGLLIFAAQTASAQPLQSQPPQSQAPQSQAQWEAAVRNESTSPSYVLVTIVNDHTKQKQTGCTEANFVKGALFREQHLPSKLESFEKVRQEMIAQHDHVFHFSDLTALSNVTFHYTPDDLQQARAAVAAYKAGITSGYPTKIPSDLLHSDALACAFIEQGYQARNADITGEILWSR